METDYLMEKIAELDSASRETVDSLIAEIETSGSNLEEFYDTASEKIAHLHRSGYDISDVEYMREKFGVPVTERRVRKAVQKRGRNSMFQRPEESEKVRLEDLCESYGVREYVEKAKKNPFNKFVRLYNKFEQKHYVIANMAVSFIGFTSGDFITQMVMRGSYELRDLAIMGPLAAYYAWELPKLYQVVNRKIPISRYKISSKEWLNPKLLARNLKKKKGAVMRPVAIQAYMLAVWLPRHFAALELKHAQPLETAVENLKTLDFAKTSTAVGLGQLPISLLWGYIVHNKIDLQYRFLSVSAVNMVWSAIASYLAN